MAKYILVIEDDDFVVDLYKECLSPEVEEPPFPNHQIIILTNLDDVYKFYDEYWEDIDVIVTDSDLPDGTGEEFIAKIKEMVGKQYRKKIIFVAGQPPKTGYEILFFRIFQKPVGISDFLESIKAALEASAK